MGSSLSNSKEYNDFVSSYSSPKPGFVNPHNGRVFVYKKNGTEEQVVELQKEFGLNQTDESDAFRSQGNLLLAQNAKYTTQFLFASESKMEAMCDRRLIAQMFFDYSGVALDEYVEATQFRSSDPSQMGLIKASSKDLYRFFYCTFKGLRELESRGSYSGFITPQDIRVTRSEGQINFIVPNYRPIATFDNIYEKVSFDTSFLAPLDPFLASQFAERKSKVEYSIASDKWALGLCALGFIYNRPISQYYDWDNRKLLNDKVEKDLHSLRQENYDSTVVSVIEDLMRPDPKDRPSFDQMIRKYFPDRASISQPLYYY